MDCIGRERGMGGGGEYEISAALIPILATIYVIRLETSRFGAGRGVGCPSLGGGGGYPNPTEGSWNPAALNPKVILAHNFPKLLVRQRHWRNRKKELFCCFQA
jgi:hypothetical protein